MMIRRKLFLLQVFVFVFGLSGFLKSQSNVAILLNEYSASNTGGPSDAFGSPSDWVELRNAHTSSVSLASYYLSNDRNNLFKWKFPQNFVMSAGELKAVWLSGKNTTKNGEVHANFTLEQCKNQWLILSTSQGVVRDSIFIQKTKAGHTRGRIDITSIGVTAWKLYTSHSYLIANPTLNNYVDYCPIPKMVANPMPSPASAANVNAGGFFSAEAAPIVYFKLENNLAYDSAYSCFNIYYTTDGSYPIPNQTGTTLYPDSVNGTQGLLSLALTTVIRAVAVPKPWIKPGCNGTGYLPSFCETNTYFVGTEHNAFSPDFGVISLAMDASWFNTNGAFSPTIHTEYYVGKVQQSEGYAQINRPPQEEWRTKQRGMYINLDDRQGFGCAFEGPVFNVDLLGTSTRTFFPTLHLKAGDIESNSEPNSGGGASEGTALRDVLVQSIAAKYKINVNPLHIKPVIAFVNGKYYGVFDLREVYDKDYENYYHSQSKDSLTLAFYHNTDGAVTYVNGTSSNFNNNFKAKVYDVALIKPMNSATFYNQVMAELDKSSFIDYFIMNSYFMNSDIWNYNVAYAKGGQTQLPGGKWHYYMWNAPTVLNYTSVATNSLVYTTINKSPCDIYYLFSNNTSTVSVLAGNGHSVILDRLMNPVNGNKSFQMEYKNRYQDLLNGPLKCENILKHFDALNELYKKEMNYHSDPATGLVYGTATQPDPKCWDSNMVRLRTKIADRCYLVSTFLNKPGCYGMTGPFNITVDVKPDSSAGRVKLNSEILPTYVWNGRYYSTQMSFKAIPTSTAYVFDHWEFKNPQAALDPLSKDSIGFTFNQPEEVIAIFTDKTKDLVGSGDDANVPTGFTPNGDLLNDVFKPLGSAKFTTEYEMTIWSRWGEEVFRSTSPLDGWDGNFKGNQAITGVYAYVIKYKNVYGESKILKGNVTLTR